MAPLSFVTRDDKPGRPWWRYLDLGGKPLYLISNMCGTCEAIFKRVGRQDAPLTPEKLSVLLNEGLETVPQEVVDTVAVLLPYGRYRIGLLHITPSLIKPSNKPRGLSCDADYFWLSRYRETEREAEYEIVLPSVPQSELDSEQLSTYQAMFRNGRTPTALALSIGDERYPRLQYTQWALAHILLDGHHKMMAASLESKPLTILSFLTLSDSRSGFFLADDTIRPTQDYGRTYQK
jgi:hypothetical protein